MLSLGAYELLKEIQIMTMGTHIFKNFCRERNLSDGSVNVYRHALKAYEKYNGMSLEELLDEADLEEEQKIRWKRRTLKSRLIDFRNYLIDYGYAKETINTMMKRVTTFYRHYEIEIHHLPKVNIQSTVEIKIPGQDDLQKAVNICSPIMKAIILTLASSGLSKVDLLKLTLSDFMEFTKEYHNETDIYKALEILKEKDDVIPTFSLTRTKTGKFHHTFCSPEATIAIIQYLLSRTDKLTPESKLFKISYHWLTVKFEDLNEQLNLGVTEGNEYCVLRCHTLRKYHATTLKDDGLSIDVINSFQGKARNKVDAAYFVDTPEKLKVQYMEHVSCLAVDMEIKNIDLKSEEFIRLEYENEQLREAIDNIDSKIEDKINAAINNRSEVLSEEEIVDLFS